MTDSDKELADRVVALDVGYHLEGGAGDGYFSLVRPAPRDQWISPGPFVRDWRVAGALMERCLHDGLILLISREDGAAICSVQCPVDNGNRSQITVDDDDCLMDTVSESKREETPRAIIEACVKALEQSDD